MKTIYGIVGTTEKKLNRHDNRKLFISVYMIMEVWLC